MDMFKTRRIVIKVGTSTLTYENGKVNLRRLELLCKVLSDLHNSGKEIILVSSGAIGVGMGKLKLKKRPAETRYKQALAAVGQCELMFLYDKFFGEYNNSVAQVLLTKNVVINDHSRQNVINTFRTLLEMDIIPIVNENDTVAIDELVGANFGDNDNLSAIVADLVGADLLVILTDIDGLNTGNGRRFRFQQRYRRYGYQNHSGSGGYRCRHSLLCHERQRPCQHLQIDRRSADGNTLYPRRRQYVKQCGV